MDHRHLLAQAAEPDGSSRFIRHLVESAAFVGIGLVAFLIAFFLMTKISPFSIRKEIEEDQNVALGIIVGSVILGLALIISAAIQG